MHKFLEGRWHNTQSQKLSDEIALSLEGATVPPTVSPLFFHVFFQDTSIPSTARRVARIAGTAPRVPASAPPLDCDSPDRPGAMEVGGTGGKAHKNECYFTATSCNFESHHPFTHLLDDLESLSNHVQKIKEEVSPISSLTSPR